MKYLTTVGLALLSGALAAWTIYVFLPMSLLELPSEPRLGASITTINGSDTISSSRTTINNNFSALNTDLVALQGAYFPFAITSYGNSTSTIIGFTGGLMSMASSSFSALLNARNATTSLLTADTLWIPSAADPSVASRQFSINSTAASSSLRWNDGTAERSVSDIVERGFTLASTSVLTGTTTIPLGFAKRGETWLTSSCKLDQGAAQIDFGDGTNLMGTQALTSVRLDTTLSTNNAFTLNEAREVRVGSTTPNWNYLTCSFTVRLNAD